MHKIEDIPVSVEYTNSAAQESIVAKNILEPKRPRIGEIELTLFENCNIVCDFCFHDKTSSVGLSYDEMLSKVSIIGDFVKSKKDTVDLIQINIVGGELFQDKWMESMCDQYFDLCVVIRNVFRDYDVPLKIVWVSNFLFKKKETVKKLIDKLWLADIDASLIASYDFSGRPMSARGISNIEWFGPEYISSINLVGTSTSIRTFMATNDPVFDRLYDTYVIYFDDFIPDKGSDDEIPSDQLIADWYIYIADNYPKIYPIANLLDNSHNVMHCLSLNKITIFPDNSTSNCRWNRYTPSDFNTPINIADNSNIMESYITETGCLSCEYFNRCGLRCFVQWDWKNRVRDTDTCPMRIFFNHITSP